MFQKFSHIARSLVNKKWPLAILLLLVVIPIWASLYPQQKVLIVENKPVADVGGKLVYLKDIQQTAREENSSATMTSEVLRTAFEALSEQILLDMEANNLQFTISDEDIKESLKPDVQSLDQPTPTEKELSAYEKKIARYNLIKEKVTKASLESREAYSIGFDLIPYSDNKERYTRDELNFFEMQKDSINKVLPMIRKRLIGGEIFLSLARSIYNNYPYLQKIMKVNEYFIRSTNSENLIRDPRLYIYDKTKVGNVFFDTIFSLEVNQAKLIFEQNTPSGYVIQVKTIHNEGIHTYEDWLDMKKKELVRKYISI